MADLPAIPAGARPAPTCPEDADAWTAEECVAWAPDAIRAVVQAEVTVEEMRIAVGLVLYRMRAVLGDGDFGHAAAELAGIAGVTFRTLLTWRDRAEAHFQLAPPSARAIVHREKARKPVTPPLPLASEAAAPVPTPAPAPVPAPRAAPEPPPPAALPQPVTQTDYRRLVGLIITAGPEALRKSVDAVELHKARRVLAEATAIPKDAAGDRCSCQKPVISKLVSNLCTGCGKRRPG